MSSKRKKLVNRRKELNLTQKQIAEAVGVTSRTVQSWELGENVPKLDPLQTWKLCEVLQCTIVDLAEYFFPNEFEDVVIAEQIDDYHVK